MGAYDSINLLIRVTGLVCVREVPYFPNHVETYPHVRGTCQTGDMTWRRDTEGERRGPCAKSASTTENLPTKAKAKMRTAAAILALTLTLTFSMAMAKEDLSVVPELGTYIRCWGYVANAKVINDLIDYTVDGTLPGKDTCKFVQKASDDGFCIPNMFLIWQEKYGYNRDHMIELEDHCKKFH